MSGIFYSSLKNFFQNFCEPSSLVSGDVEDIISQRLKKNYAKREDLKLTRTLNESSLGKTLIICDSIFSANGKRDISGVELVHPYSEKLNNLYYQTRESFSSFYSYYEPSSKVRRLAIIDDTFPDGMDNKKHFVVFCVSILEILKKDNFSTVIFFDSFSKTTEALYSVAVLREKERTCPDSDIVINELSAEVTKESLLKAVEKIYPSSKAVYLYGNYDKNNSFVNINKLFKKENSLFTNYPLILIRCSHGGSFGFSYMVYSLIDRDVVEHIKNPRSKKAKRLLSLFFNKLLYFEIPFFSMEHKKETIKRDFISFEDALLVRKIGKRVLQNAFGTSANIDIRIQGIDGIGDFECDGLGFMSNESERYCTSSRR